ncbi:uncharacterized protein LOC134444490 [Engraulis encrasicolus]|uniref:uncharacterized protein LOC134444490 n=1 Tax=Engraulis encrasicolus TaxID=184585 RepID=UPI002FD6BFB0
MTSLKWQGLRCKQCHIVWHKNCLLKSSEDWDMSDDDYSSGEEYNPSSLSESESSEMETERKQSTHIQSDSEDILKDMPMDFESAATLQESGSSETETERKQSTHIQSDSEDILKDMPMDFESAATLQESGSSETETERKKSTHIQSTSEESLKDMPMDFEPEMSESCLHKSNDDNLGKGTVGMFVHNKPEKMKDLKSQVNYCFVCGKPQTKIARHLQTHLSENAEIAQAFQAAKSSKERKILLEKLRNLGNFKHNTDVKTTGSGCLKVKRSSKKSSNPEMYDYCLYCKGMMARQELSRHMRKCPLRPDVNTEERERVPAIASSQSTMSQPISSSLWAVLGKMHKDEVSTAIKNDHYLLQFAQSLFNRHGIDPAKHEYIRQKVREVGRLLVTLRKTTQIYNLEECLKPANFMILTSAVKTVSGFDPKNNIYKSPSLA